MQVIEKAPPKLRIDFQALLLCCEQVVSQFVVFVADTSSGHLVQTEHVHFFRCSIMVWMMGVMGRR